VIKQDQANNMKVASLHEGSPQARFILGPCMFSAFYALVSVLAAAFAIYSSRVALYWLVSPALLAVAVLIVSRAISLRKEILRTHTLMGLQPAGEALDTCIRLVKALATNFIFGMYGIGSAMIVVSWITRTQR